MSGIMNLAAPPPIRMARQAARIQDAKPQSPLADSHSQARSAEANLESRAPSAFDIINRWLEPTVERVQSRVSVSPVDSFGLEVAGEMVTGTPGGVLKMVFADGPVRATMLDPGGQSQELKVLERSEWGQYQARVGLPDGTELVVQHDPFTRVELTRVHEGTGCHMGFQFGLDSHYRMSDFELAHSPELGRWDRLGADTLDQGKARAWVKRDTDTGSHTLFATAGEQPILYAPGATNVPVDKVLTGLEAAARTVNEKHYLVVPRG